MRTIPLLVALPALLASLGCPPKAEDKPLPPSGLAGSPTTAAAHGAAGSPGTALPGTGVAAVAPSGSDPGLNLPAGHPPIDDAAVAAAAKTGPTAPPIGEAALQIKGKVLEVLEVPGYTYLRLDTPGGEVWAAVAKAPIKVGDSVAIAQPMMMENFPSKALNRTFAKLIMGSLVVGGAAAAPTPAAAPMPAPHKGDHPNKPDHPGKTEPGKG